MTERHPSHARTAGLAGALAVVLLACALAAAPVRPAAGAALPAPRVQPPALGHVGPAVVQPALSAALSRGPAPAILSWDRALASHGQIAAHLRRAGVAARVLDVLPAALLCLRSPAALRASATAPGAVSVWGEEGLVPTVDESRATAFNGAEDHVHRELGLRGEGVGIAVVDTGLDGTHPDLQGKVRSNLRTVLSHREITRPTDPPPCEDVYGEEVPDSELTSGHGTHLASIAAGTGAASGGRLHGVAPEAHLLGVGVNDTITPEAPGPTPDANLSLSGAVAGFNHILLHGLGAPHDTKVVLAGWSGQGLHDPFHPISLAVRDLWHFDITVVFPAGNRGGPTSDCSAAATCRFNPFATGGHALAVGATPKRSRTELAPFSSRGDPEPREARGEQFTYEPDVVAPGVNVTAARRLGTAGFGVGTTPGAAGSIDGDQSDLRYVAHTGTSVAAAHVAGAIALLQQEAKRRTGCFLSVGQVRNVLTASASPMPGYARHEVGAGALDIGAAIALARRLDRNTNPNPWVCS